LTGLGLAFLTVFYRQLTALKDCVCSGVRAGDGTLVGFVAGTTNPGDPCKRILRAAPLRLLLPAIPALILGPSKLWRVLRYLCRAIFFKRAQPLEVSHASTLLSLCVLPEYRRHRLGVVLVEAFESGLRARGGRAVELYTDAANNEAVNAFYLRMGYQLIQTSTSGTRAMNKYHKELSSL
jgi:ribosomal protein S18 acetylase RimI-like enzyme